ncbi:zinc ribbon domain-containing protein [Coprococcus comes]|uniref:zinc ribbon domain-containing protein n=1 Tax=Coprococcus comes TaxID=410072 RepID=UPI001898FA15|nr:zinc ribbon domain-containing protein [Coprococcus comes]
MYCKNCGYKLGENAKFCRNCGARVQETEENITTKNLKRVKATYIKDNGELKITYNEKKFDTSRIKNISIEQWAYPFLNKGIKWNGLYEELKDFTGCTEFILQFDSDEESFATIKNALASQPVKLVGTNNTVTIVYSENPFSTRITINGKVFDTTLLQNRCIDEWIQPFQVREVHWNGIFKELEDYIGTDKYTVYFMGDQKLMSYLIDACPETVSIFYKAFKVHQKSKTLPNIGNINTEKINMDNLTDMAQKTVSSLKEKINNTTESTTKTSSTETNNQELSMKWYDFLSKYGMIFYMISSCLGVVFCIIMMSMVGFGTDYLIYALCYVASAIVALKIRKRLLNFQKDTNKILTIYFSVCVAVMAIANNTTLRVARGPFIPWLLSQIVVIILIYLNYTYFKKREHLFCN